MQVDLRRLVSRVFSFSCCEIHHPYSVTSRSTASTIVVLSESMPSPVHAMFASPCYNIARASSSSSLRPDFLLLVGLLSVSLFGDVLVLMHGLFFTF